MSRMQSLPRAIKRGNAIVCFDNVSKKPYIVRKKGCGAEEWNKQNRYFRSFELEQNIINS